MRYYYLILSYLTIRKIQNRLMDIVLYYGKDICISKNCTAGEMYVKMKDTYTEGIKTIKTSSEMKEHYELLSKFNSEIKLCCESLKKE